MADSTNLREQRIEYAWREMQAKASVDVVGGLRRLEIADAVRWLLGRVLDLEQEVEEQSEALGRLHDRLSAQALKVGNLESCRNRLRRKVEELENAGAKDAE